MSELILNPKSGLPLYFSWLNGTSDSVDYPQLLKDTRKRLDECGEKVIYVPCESSSCGGYRAVIQRCQNRLCDKPECLKYRRYRTVRRYEPKINAMKFPRFLTLTVQGYHEKVDHSLIDSINRPWKLLSQYYRRKNAICSYVKALEINTKEFPIKKAGEWVYRSYYTIHAHIIYDGKYILFDRLQNKWKSFTQGSWHVRIEKPRSRFKIRNYLMKYVSKGSELDMDIHEYLAIRKAQFFSSFKLPNPKDPPTTPLLCSECDSICQFPRRRRKQYPSTFSYRLETCDNWKSPRQEIIDTVIFNQGIAFDELLSRHIGTDKETAYKMILSLEEEGRLYISSYGHLYYGGVADEQKEGNVRTQFQGTYTFKA